MEDNIVLTMRGISMTFPGVKALDHAQLQLRPGTVHALMGENGAGKSTLMKCMFGIYKMDEGEIYYEGQKVTIHDPMEALHMGIAMVHQGLYKNSLRGEWGFNGMIIPDGVGPYAWVMSPGAGLFGGVEGQLGGSAVSAYYEYEGNSSATNYGRYLLRQAAKHMLYQFCHTGGTNASSFTVTADNSWRTWQTVANVVLGAGVAVTAVVCFVLPYVKKKDQTASK